MINEPTRCRVAIVGAGFSGLGAAIRLRQAGIDDLLILERADDVGGTWRDNTYPGAACDVESHLYSFSFAPNPDWSRSFSGQAEIQAYLQGVARREGLVPYIRFGHRVRDAHWDERRDLWVIETSRGTVEARVMVSGTGALSEPSIPPLDGLDRFRGKVFHSASWDHGHDLTGERVAVIGTGASAIQFVPEIQPLVASLALFQRTPPWIVPRRDRDVTRLERWLFRNVPLTRQLVRGVIYARREVFALGFKGSEQVQRIFQLIARAHLRHQVRDPALRARLTPDYTIGCKRILISNDYYPAIQQANVELVTEAISAIEENGVRDATGTLHEADTIIFGTGFHVTDMPAAEHIRGRDGRLLAETWARGMEAYLGTTIAGYPNLFMLTGPNTGLGHTSMIYMIESQLNYLVSAVQRMECSGEDVVEVKRTAQDRYNAELQRDLASTVWLAGGCRSWYLDANGRNSTLWPDFTWRFRQRTRHFDADAYETRAGVPLEGSRKAA